MKSLIFLFIFLSSCVTSSVLSDQLAVTIPEGAKTIELDINSFDKLVNTLYMNGYTFEAIDTTYKSLRTFEKNIGQQTVVKIYAHKKSLNKIVVHSEWKTSITVTTGNQYVQTTQTWQQSKNTYGRFKIAFHNLVHLCNQSGNIKFI